MHRFTLFLTFGYFVFSCQQPSPEITREDLPGWEIKDFVKIDSVNPFLQPSPDLIFRCPLSGREIHWEARNVLNPSAVVRDNKVHLLYRAQDSSGTSRIGLAVSDDGLHFEKRAEPVFYPDDDNMKKYEWHYQKGQGMLEGQDYFDGAEDPRIVENDEGVYLMTYTSYDGKTARLCHASSPDLINWTKHGLVLSTERFRDTWSKSGAIVSRLENDRIIATKINNKYWMYYGDTDIFMATSDDLVDWQPAINEESGARIEVLHPRMGFFDSRLVEPGPYALLRENGIVLIYNGSNAANFNDPELPKFTYAAGQALFDKNYPYKLIDRSSSYFIHPDKDYEKIGEVNEVCFVEGMVYFKNKWFLYYGTADSKIAVAVSDQI
ncbi:MAG: glycosidase [Saprospiraceae bacterium]|nr:glycosidase [Saprospiraceae bacterium]